MQRRVTDWPACAAALAQAIPRESLHPAVLAWAANAGPRARWHVAFSGGADSLAVLLLLWAHWPRRRSRLGVVHFNHRLRGRASQADAAFCAEVAAALGVAFVGGEWTEAPRDASETAARAVRQAFFARHARVLWLGHQQDDIAETMLMRLARGSGSGGLAAPKPVQTQPGGRVHLRPLLTWKKADLLAALRAAGARWREDASNRSPVHDRNRFRHAVLPVWNEAARRDALAGAARSRDLLEEDEVALAAWLEELRPLRADGSLALTRLRGKPRAILRRALHAWLLALPLRAELSRQAFAALLAAVERGEPTKQSIGAHGFAAIRAGRLVFVPAGIAQRRFRGRAN